MTEQSFEDALYDIDRSDVEEEDYIEEADFDDEEDLWPGDETDDYGDEDEEEFDA